MTVMFVMQMTVVQIVGMIVVFDGGMAATGTMGMIVMIVDFVSYFDSSLSTPAKQNIMNKNVVTEGKCHI